MAREALEVPYLARVSGDFLRYKRRVSYFQFFEVVDIICMIIHWSKLYFRKNVISTYGLDLIGCVSYGFIKDVEMGNPSWTKQDLK
jgi:hypothetical protein